MKQVVIYGQTMQQGKLSDIHEILLTSFIV